MTNSTEDQSDEMQNMALATLALAVADTQVSADDTTNGVSTVSDEELIAFYQNKLNQESRAEVMQVLSRDTETYNRWIELIQTMELISELEQEELEGSSAAAGLKQRAEPVDMPDNLGGSKKKGSLNRLIGWLNKDRDWKKNLGLPQGLAVAAILSVLVIPQLLVTSQLNVSGLYDAYGRQVSSAELLPSRSITLPTDAADVLARKELVEPDKLDNEAIDLSLVSFAELANGIVAGFKGLGVTSVPAEWVVDTSRYSSDIDSQDRGDDSAYALGRLVALSLVQCRVSKSEDYFKETAPLLKKLAKQHLAAAIGLGDTGDDRNDVCRISAEIVKLV